MLGTTTNSFENIIKGFDKEQDLIDSLNGVYIACTFILSQNDFRIALFGIFPVY